MKKKVKFKKKIASRFAIIIEESVRSACENASAILGDCSTSKRDSGKSPAKAVTTADASTSTTSAEPGVKSPSGKKSDCVPAKSTLQESGGEPLNSVPTEDTLVGAGYAEPRSEALDEGVRSVLNNHDTSIVLRDCFLHGERVDTPTLEPVMPDVCPSQPSFDGLLEEAHVAPEPQPLDGILPPAQDKTSKEITIRIASIERRFLLSGLVAVSNREKRTQKKKKGKSKRVSPVIYVAFSAKCKSLLDFVLPERKLNKKPCSPDKEVRTHTTQPIHIHNVFSLAGKIPRPCSGKSI